MSNADKLKSRIDLLEDRQVEMLLAVTEILAIPVNVSHHPKSNLASNEFLNYFADLFRVHHALSDAYLDKTRFEAAMVRVLLRMGIKAQLEKSRTNPGRDIVVDGVGWSLKTQGDKSIKRDALHISKFMELGKGAWSTVADLEALRQKFFDHMKKYERVFQLRYYGNVSHAKTGEHEYELVEIPKDLLLETATAKCEFVAKTKQTPKPAYCTVDDAAGTRLELYFDAGGERKLQVRNIRKDLCIVHASWKFTI